MTEILSAKTCFCHVIDPNKSPILVWMRNNKPLVKIADQFFFGQPRVDKKGETYWRCNDFAKEKPNLSELKEELTEVEKFQARQVKTQMKNNDGPPTNAENNSNS